MEQVKVVLNDNEIPKQWYNIQADLPTPMKPVRMMFLNIIYKLIGQSSLLTAFGKAIALSYEPFLTSSPVLPPLPS